MNRPEDNLRAEWAEHSIRDEADHRAHVRYCWLNPAKHGFVGRLEDWTYSSLHLDARLQVGMDLASQGRI